MAQTAAPGDVTPAAFPAITAKNVVPPDVAAIPERQARRITLAKEALALRDGWRSMAPDAAAARWLDLADRFAADNDPIAANEKFMQAVRAAGLEDECVTPDNGRVSADVLFSALPGPSGWKALRTQIETHPAVTRDEQGRKLALRMLANLLLGDRPAFDQALSDGENWVGSLGDGRDFAGMADSLRRMSFRRNLRSPDDAVAAFQDMIEHGNTAVAGSGVSVPDVTAVLGENAARALLAKALLQTRARLSVPAGGRTLALLKEVAIENMGKLPQPAWWLVDSSADTALYEAMARRFPPHRPVKASADPDAARQEEWTAATARYLVGLIDAGRVGDAVTLAAALDGADQDRVFQERDFGLIRMCQNGEGATAFCAAVLATHANWGLQNLYCLLAGRIGRGETALASLRGGMRHAPAGSDEQGALEGLYFATLLSMNRIDEAAAFCRQTIKIRTPAREKAGGDGVRSWAKEAPEALANLGWLLDRNDWLEEGVAAMLLADADAPERFLWENLQAVKKAGRLQELEANLEKRLNMLTANGVKTDHSPETDAVLYALIAVHDAAGHSAKIIALLEQTPWWTVEDVRDLEPMAESRIGVLRALAATGHRREAAAFARRLVMDAITSEIRDACSVLVEMEGPGCIPFLDAACRDVRMDKPARIWKAAALRRGGRLDEAEAVARALVREDPTDGYYLFPFDPGSAHGVLADILEERGRPAEAAAFRQTAAAVRLMRAADKLAEGGLAGRGIPLCERAAALSGGAYFSEWRLAEQLWALGRLPEAEAHYVRAVEEMARRPSGPAYGVSNGGSLFSNEFSRRVAEKTLLRMLARDPSQPEVHVLLGVLRADQQRRGEAADCFRNALKADPACASAKANLYWLADAVPMTADERESLRLWMNADFSDLRSARGGSGIVMMPAWAGASGSTRCFGAATNRDDFPGIWEWAGRAPPEKRNGDDPVFPMPAAKAYHASLPVKPEWLQRKAQPRMFDDSCGGLRLAKRLSEHDMAGVLLRWFQCCCPTR